MNLCRCVLLLAIGILLTVHASRAEYEEIPDVTEGDNQEALMAGEEAPIVQAPQPEGRGTTVTPLSFVADTMYKTAGGISIFTGAFLAALGAVNMRGGIFGIGPDLFSTNLQVANLFLIMGTIVLFAIAIVLKLVTYCTRQ